MSSVWRKWRGDAARQMVRSVAVDMAAALGAAVERNAKRQLRKGRGVKTGALRRDIRSEKPKAEGLVITVRAGTYVDYAPYVEFGHQSFPGYAFMQIGLHETMRDDLPRLMQEYGFKWRSR